VVLGGGVPVVGPQEELPLRLRLECEWIHSQGVYFGPTAGGEIRIFGFYNNKKKYIYISSDVRQSCALRQVQPVPWKMRLEMLKEIQIEILNGGEILVNQSKSRKSNFSVSHGTRSN